MGQPIQPAPLVVEPSGNPTRKWTAARITELLTGVLAFAAIFGFDLPDTIDVEQLVGAVVILVTAGGGIAGWLTHNRANT